MSNHAHLLLVVDAAKQLAKFMGYVNGDIAKEAGRLHFWRDRACGAACFGTVHTYFGEAGRLSIGMH